MPNRPNPPNKRRTPTPSPVTSAAPLRPFVPPPAPKTPKSAGTRRRLVDLAARLFIERGYDAVSMRDIAAAGELTKGAVYGHFRSKGQLLVEVIRWKLAEHDASIDFAEAQAGPTHGIELMYHESGREARLLEVDAAAAARHDPEVAAGLANLYEERQARIRDAMSDLADPDTAAWVFAALSAGIGMKEASGVALPDPDRLTATIWAAVEGLMWQPVRPPSATPKEATP
jgi:AcrR family transcriptional regulator